MKNMPEKKKKSWFKKHKIMTGIMGFFLFLVIIGIFQGIGEGITGEVIKDSKSSTNNIEIGKIIKAPDTKKVLFTLKGTEIVEGDCSTAKSFNEYGVILPKDCVGISSLNIANYCELGNKKGENVNNYYCRPTRFMKCKLISSSGDVEDVKYYSITKVLKCDNTKEQLIDVKVKSCTADGFGFDCS